MESIASWSSRVTLRKIHSLVPIRINTLRIEVTSRNQVRTSTAAVRLPFTYRPMTEQTIQKQKNKPWGNSEEMQEEDDIVSDITAIDDARD